MQLPTQSDYEQIAAMARDYRDLQIRQLKQASVYNPHLGVDGLCFERRPLDGLDGPGLIGALITPCALWLVAMPVRCATHQCLDSLALSLPSGRYRLDMQPLQNGHHCYMCRILDDLSDLETMAEAAQLAQRLMERIMAPGVEQFS